VRRGAVTLTEKVRLIPEEAVEFAAQAGTALAGSTLTMRIEEPVPGALFMRFVYELKGTGIPEDDAEQRALRQAYYYADLDTVRRIRAFTEHPAAQADDAAGAPPVA
jgi:hypothetical protein